MENFIKDQTEKLKEIMSNLGYETDNVTLVVSSRKDLGDYQYNGVMPLAKKYIKNPREIADEIVSKMKESSDYSNVNVAGPGFINISFSKELLCSYMTEIQKDFEINLGDKKRKKIVIDYGGPNVAKTLHVGHLRSANIGEALKRLTKELGCEVIADVHLGDWGRQMGLVILELKRRFPDWSYFDENYKGEYPNEFSITNQDLESLYPIASQKAKEDELYLDEAREITTKLQNKEKGYYALWQKIVEISTKEIKKTYEDLNISFDLWEGESDADKYIPDVIQRLKDKGLLYETDGALAVDVSEPGDKVNIPPLLVIKSNGSVSYETTDLATLWGRMKNFNPDEVWYVVDKRQELHFTQVFRAARKSGIVKEHVKLEFIGFGTMNGKDGKPFKTRDGGVMTLSNLVDVVKNETVKRLNPNIKENEKDEISNIIKVATIKYADLLSNRATDYIFDPEKFSDMNGKTGTYLLYSTIRIKSLLNKAKEQNLEIGPINTIVNEYDNEVVLNLLQMPMVLEESYKDKTLNEIAEYLFKLTNSYNNFYEANRILTESDEAIRSSWLGLSENVLKTNTKLIDILGIEIPKKM